MISEEYKVRTFYDGLTPFTQAIVDNACGGVLTKKSAAEITEIYETLALNSYHRGSTTKKGGKYDIDRSTEVAIQLSTMTKQMEALTKNVSQLQAGANHVCDGGHHCRDRSQVEAEEAQALNYQRGRNDPYSNTYNL